MASFRELLFGTPPPAASPLPPEPSPRAADATRAAHRFRAYNRARRSLVDEQSGRRGSEALRLLPFLLHVNQPGLPGYLEIADCPTGIADYAPTRAELELARRLFPHSQAKRTGILQPAVDLVAVMGSAGTVGFTGESDLDVWICYRDSRQAALHQPKVRQVEAWLTEHSGLEIHLFAQPTAAIRGNRFGRTDLEGCGSAMGALLKEEFYRTGVLLAGKTPFWWVLRPHEAQTEYAAAILELQQDPTFPSDGFVDLGWVESVPPGELFGAAVWQIVKGWKSPFKSALKLGLLEKVVASGTDVAPLCEVLKQQVLAGAQPDPYRVLFDAVVDFYREAGDSASEDLLTRCFYLKVGAQVDPDTPPPAAGPGAVMHAYVERWGWGRRRLLHMNGFGSWRFELVHDLASELDGFFLGTYRRIRARLDETGETQRITERDLTVLGRTLQAVYRRAPHKLETLHLVTGGVAEATLSLYQETLPDGEAPWRLYRGRVTPLNVDDSEGDLLRSSGDLVELLAWAAQNHLLGPHTRLLCRGLERTVSAAEVEGLAQRLVAFVARAEQTHHSPEVLLEEPHTVQLLVVPNLALGRDRVREVAALYHTTWGETFYRRWAGGDALRAFMDELFAPFLLAGGQPDVLEVYASSEKVGASQGPARRLRRELPAIAAFLAANGPPEQVRARCVGQLEGGFFVLDRVGAAELRYRALTAREALLRYLSAVGPYRAVATRVESHSGDLALLKAIVDTSAPGQIDLFVLEEPDRETLFVADEVGNLIHFEHPPQEGTFALAKLLVFLQELLPELAAQTASPLHGLELLHVLRIHSLVYEGACRALTSTQEHLARARSLGLQPIGLSIERTAEAEGHSGYRVVWGDKVIDSQQVANPLEEVRRLIQQARRSQLDYEVTVTRLFLDDSFRNLHCGPFVTTGHYLFYKKAVEQRLRG